MGQPLPRSASRVRLAVPVLLALLLPFASPPFARADTLGFAFLIENGVQFAPGTESATDSTGLAAFRALGRPLRLIVNGQKGDVVGTADVLVWGRSVPDPFFAPFGPLAALGVLRVFGLEAHLGLIETPAGLRTTIAVVQDSPAGPLLFPWRGTWLFGPGTLVGGDSDDLIVAGTLVVPGTETPLSPASFDLNLYFPTVPFPSDPTPGATHSVFFFEVGSFYGQAQVGGVVRPVRGFTSANNLLVGYRHLLVIHAGGDDYVVVACTSLALFLGVVPIPQLCTVSGTGLFTGALTGFATYEALASPPSLPVSLRLDLTPFLTLP